MFTAVEAKAPSATLAVEVLSHAPPAVVVPVRFTLSDPPPAFETEMIRERKGDCCTYEKFKDTGLTLRLGWPGAVTVSETESVWTGGFASGGAGRRRSPCSAGAALAGLAGN